MLTRHILYYTGMQQLYVLGRQPALGIAELESLCGASSVTPFGKHCALVVSDNIPNFSTLGGSTKQANVIMTIENPQFKAVEKEITKIVRSSAFALPDSGKFHLGLSAIGFKSHELSPAKLNALGLTLKKIVRSRYDGSVRLAPNKTLELSSAQVYHSHLSDEHGAELLIISDGQKTVIARTSAVQDIDSYTQRDRGRPKRDARVGMLPPKLAQIILNLALGKHADTQENITILDPFCGTGVTLQEALLMGHRAYGTDLEPRMIAYSRENLDWLSVVTDLKDIQKTILEPGDATSHKWHLPIDFVACETYLGLPFTSMPDRKIFDQNIRDVNLILSKFLTNIHPQLNPGTRMCLAIPAWNLTVNDKSQLANRFRRLPMLDSLEEIGYNQVEFERVRSDDLIYYRDDQIVARQLLVLTVK